MAASFTEDVQETLDALRAALPVSRAVLLGSRDPRQQSCIGRIQARGNTLLTYADPNGGCGTKLLATMSNDATPATPTLAYEYYQNRVGGLLRAMRSVNADALEAAEMLESHARDLAARARKGRIALGQPLPAVSDAKTWPAFCLRGLTGAAQAGMPEAAEAWGREFEASAFALADLHRWLEFVLANQLEALAFQTRCRRMFVQATTNWKVEPDENSYDGFPGATDLKPLIDNLYEIERQAEALFVVPAAYLERTLSGESVVRGEGATRVPAALWIPPDLRARFVQFRSALSAPNQTVWDAAAAAPYDRTYVVNMLFRHGSRPGMVDKAVEVLRRFDRVHPNGAPRERLLDVLFYRGDGASGYTWDERYDDRLMEAAAALHGTDEQVLQQARDLTNRWFAGWDRYKARSTLASCLDTGTMDCINATTFVAALYRNAGRGGFLPVWWCCGTEAHALAGARVERSGQPEVVVVDGLDLADGRAVLWPWGYFSGPSWPRGFPNRQPGVHAIELYVRGLDNYVWGEGYVVRGPEAGVLAQAAVPYLPDRPKSRVAKVFGGPYPGAAASAGG